MNNARAPSGSLIACDSNDVVKTAKSQRKNRLLIQLPGLLSPLSAGAIGTLKNIDGETPSLSLDLPDGSSLELTGRRQTSSRAFMSLKMGDDVLGVKDVFETLIVFDCDQDLTDAQAGDASALKGPPDFEYGLSAVAAAGKSAKAPRRSGGVVCDSSGDEDDDDLDILETEPGSRRSSGRARKQVSYNVGHDDDDDEEEDDDDGGDFDLDDEVPLSPPPKPKRKRKDDEFDLDDEVPISPPKPKPKPRARKVSEPKPKAKPKRKASSSDDDVVELSNLFDRLSAEDQAEYFRLQAAGVEVPHTWLLERVYTFNGAPVPDTLPWDASEALQQIETEVKRRAALKVARPIESYETHIIEDVPRLCEACDFSLLLPPYAGDDAVCASAYLATFLAFGERNRWNPLDAYGRHVDLHSVTHRRMLKKWFDYWSSLGLRPFMRCMACSWRWLGGRF